MFTPLRAIRLLAKAGGVRRQQISLVRGETGRQKVVAVPEAWKWEGP